MSVTLQTDRHQQRGAALLIVLLLVATLSFVALSITEKTSLAAARSINERIRAESLWNAFGAEALAISVIQSAYASTGGKVSIDDPWHQEPIDVPLDNGLARLFFVDNTACFNLNSLTEEVAKTEFVDLLGNLGLSGFESDQLADVITDWIDVDTNRLPLGAEDGHYTLLPSPYRTGNQSLVTISEIRAMKDVKRDIYAGLKPYICALPISTPTPININMLTEGDAPILAAALGPSVSAPDAEALIALRPPGGFADTAVFMELPQIKALDTQPEAARFVTTSQYLQARAEIIYDNAVLEVTMDIAIDQSGRAVVLARRLGPEE